MVDQSTSTETKTAINSPLRSRLLLHFSYDNGQLAAQK